MSWYSDHGDCRLRTDVFARPWDVWRMEIDLFSSPTSGQRHPRTGEWLWAVSPYRCETKAGVDGLTFSSCKVLFAFPPAAILPALKPRVVKLGLRVVLIVPVWIQAEWWPLVSGLPTINCGKVRDRVLAGEAGLSHCWPIVRRAHSTKHRPACQGAEIAVRTDCAGTEFRETRTFEVLLEISHSSQI